MGGLGGYDAVAERGELFRRGESEARIGHPSIGSPMSGDAHSNHADHSKWGETCVSRACDQRPFRRRTATALVVA